jgi:hypothetical protein
MTPFHQERLKSLLDVMVRRHAGHGHANHPVGQLIADEALRMRGDTLVSNTGVSNTGTSDGAASDDPRQELVDRLYRRFLLPRHSTVEALAEIDSVNGNEISK